MNRSMKSDDNNRGRRQKPQRANLPERPLQPVPNMLPNYVNIHQMQPFSRQQQQVHGQLELKTKVKPTKLLSSKSLSRLVPRSLFFKKGSSVNNASNNANEYNNKLATTKSFPSAAMATHLQPDNEANAMEINEQQLFESESPLAYANPIKSASLIGLPRQSTRNLFNGAAACSTPVAKQSPEFSPILALGAQLGRSNQCEPLSFASTTTDSGFDCSAGQRTRQSASSRIGNIMAARQSQPELDSEPAKELQAESRECGEEKRKKYKPFKSTTLVLRDVKNSIGLRMKARQERQAFGKLTNEVTSPPTKLYSPFNIYTDSASKPRKEPTAKSKRKLDMTDTNKRSGEFDQNCSMMSVDEVTPKHRVALQHKKHLLHANKFTFDSPTGRLRESVKDVEHFQQCIEDISKAIRDRNRSE